MIVHFKCNCFSAYLSASSSLLEMLPQRARTVLPSTAIRSAVLFLGLKICYVLTALGTGTSYRECGKVCICETQMVLEGG